MYTQNNRRIIASVLVLALSGVGALSTVIAVTAGSAKADNPKDEAKIVGQLNATGSVTINDKKAINGTSVFTNSQIKVACAKGNSAIVNLGRMGRIELSSGSEVTLRFSDGLISGDLTAGEITVKAPVGVKIAIATSGRVAASDGKEPAVLPVRAQRGQRCVPLVISSTNTQGIGAGPLAALLAGAGGAAAIGALAANDDNTASNTVP